MLGAIKDFEFKTHQYNDLMQQEPEKVPLLFGRDKVLAENKKLLKDQQAGIKPKLQLKINRSSIPDYTRVFMKAIQEHKNKLIVFERTETKNSQSNFIEKTTQSYRNQIGVKKRL